MAKVIAALNMTINGICDHTAGIPDSEIHQHYTELLGQGEAILYGKTTYQLMQFWQALLENPSQQKTMNNFAVAINNIPKIVFSHTLKTPNWKTATIAKHSLKDQVLQLKKQATKHIFIGSRSLIIQLLELNLIDEFQLCIHPMVQANGLPLFKDLNQKIIFNLVKTKTFKNGAILLYYQPKNK